jgi:O-antigen/teichoic acid export membrane protein
VSAQPSEDHDGSTDEPAPAAERRMSRVLGGDLIRYVPSQAIPAVLAFIAIPVITRLFSPEEYGDYRLVLASAEVFVAVAFWVGASVYRFYPELAADDALGRLRSTSIRTFLLTQVALTVLWIGLLALAWDAVRPQFRYLMVIGLVLMNANATFGLAASFARSQRQIGWFSSAVVFQKAVGLFGGVAIIVAFGVGVAGLLAATIAATVISTLVLIRVAARRLPAGDGALTRDLARSMLKYAAPLIVMRWATWALALGDRYMIAWLGTTAEVGLYSAPYGIAEQSVAVILTLFEIPFVILSSQVWERDGPEAASRFVSSGARAYLLLAVPAAFGISALATPVMDVMTAPEYRVASSIIPWISASLLLFGIQFWFMAGALFHKKTQVNFLAIMSGVVVNVALNLALIPRFGYQAAAWTTFVSYATSLTAMILLTRRFFRWEFPTRSLIRTLAASSLMAAVLVAFQRATDLGSLATLGAGLALGLATYSVLLLALGEVPEVTSRLRRR